MNEESKTKEQAADEEMEDEQSTNNHDSNLTVDWQGIIEGLKEFFADKKIRDSVKDLIEYWGEKLCVQLEVETKRYRYSFWYLVIAALVYILTFAGIGLLSYLKLIDPAITATLIGSLVGYMFGRTHGVNFSVIGSRKSE